MPFRRKFRKFRRRSKFRRRPKKRRGLAAKTMAMRALRLAKALAKRMAPEIKHKDNSWAPIPIPDMKDAGGGDYQVQFETQCIPLVEQGVGSEQRQGNDIMIKNGRIQMTLQRADTNVHTACRVRVLLINFPDGFHSHTIAKEDIFDLTARRYWKQGYFQGKGEDGFYRPYQVLADRHVYLGCSYGPVEKKTNVPAIVGDSTRAAYDEYAYKTEDSYQTNIAYEKHISFKIPRMKVTWRAQDVLVTDQPIVNQLWLVITKYNTPAEGTTVQADTRWRFYFTDP